MALSAFACTASFAADRPNLLLILADDLGYGDLGCYGGTMAPTPNVNRLATEGVRCTDGYVTAPVCAPSRCGIMSGSYNQRFGIQWNDDRSKYNFGAGHQLLPQALRAAGYVTGHIGKWNVGTDSAGCFDEVYDLIDWEADYFPDAKGHYVGVDSTTEHASSKRQGLWGPERPGEEYLTDRIGRHAVEFINKHKSGPKPFFLYLAFNAVHSPFHAKKEAAAQFAAIKSEPLRYYAAMLASLDENVGKVLAALPENTLVVFISDNGPAKSGVLVWPETWPKEEFVFGSAGPLRGHKAQLFEGGMREPYIVRWPGKLKAGQVYRQPVSTMDIYPTMCAAAGAAIPAGTRLDGVNLLPYLQGEKSGLPHEILFWKFSDNGAVRQGDWKLLITPFAPNRQLFNLAEDIAESKSLLAEKPEIAERLYKAWLDWSAALPEPASAKDKAAKAAKAGPAAPKKPAPKGQPGMAEGKVVFREAINAEGKPYKNYDVFTAEGKVFTVTGQTAREGAKVEMGKLVGHQIRISGMFQAGVTNRFVEVKEVKDLGEAK